MRKAWRRELEKLVGVLAREGAAGAEDTKAEVLKLLDNPHQLATLETECEKVLSDKTKVPNSKDRGKALALISTFAEPDGLQPVKRSL